MSTSAQSHTLSKDLSSLVGNRVTASRTDILTAIIRYAAKHDLLSDDHILTPDHLLSELFDSTDPIHIKDIFPSLRPHMTTQRPATR